MVPPPMDSKWWHDFDAVVAWLTEERIVRERFGEHLPLSLYQANWNMVMLGQLGMVGWDRMTAGMEDDVADGMESRKYAPMSNGSARRVT